MYYTLFNKRNRKYLEHPSYGTWHADNKQEATEMLEVCQNYIRSMDLEQMVSDFVLVEFESLDELER